MQIESQPPGRDQLLAALGAEKWSERRNAVRLLGEVLRGPDGAEQAGAFASELERLAGDSSSEVRLAVTIVLQYFRHETFDRIVARLVDDSNAYVRRAANQTVRRRKQETSIPEAEDGIDAVRRQIEKIKQLHSPKAAEDAIALGEMYYEAYCAAASHQMLNVLTPLKKGLKRLADTLDNSGADRGFYDDLLKKARTRAEHLVRIAEALKAHAAQVRPKFHKENLRSMVLEALETVRDEFRQRVVAEEVKIEDELMIDAPRDALLQVFMSVMKNAFEAVDQEGTLEVLARVQTDGQVEVRFTDNGCGVAQEALGDVFLPFTSNKDNHTGYGLPLARKIVERGCSGTMAVESTEGVGTTVIIRLPMEQEQ